jgi:hypothetical protein
MFCAICAMASEEAALAHAHACRLAFISAWANQLGGDEGAHMHKCSCARLRAYPVTKCDALQQQAHARISVKLKHVNTDSSTSNGLFLANPKGCHGWLLQSLESNLIL